MFETSNDSLFLFPYEEEEKMVDDLLSSEGSGGGGGLSLAEALLPLAQAPPHLSSSPAAIPWLYSTRYKTELCSRYAETGDCKYAERCQFAHGLRDLHVPSRHPKYKTELCRTYHTAGYCLYGTRCLFVHDSAEQRPAHWRRRNVPCRTYCSFGVCPFGTRCKFLHIDDEEGPKSPDVDADGKVPLSPPPPASGPPASAPAWEQRRALCRTFSSFGFCLYGTRCRFQHGLPSAVVRGSRHASRRLGSRALSPGSEMFSSSSPSPTPSPPPSELASPVYLEDAASPTTATPPLNDPMAHNAFTFSSQHLNDLLLPLALRLQQLENSQASAGGNQGMWDN